MKRKRKWLPTKHHSAMDPNQWKIPKQAREKFSASLQTT